MRKVFLTDALVFLGGASGRCVTGYMLGFSTFMPLTAWLRDRVGYRMLYIASLAVFIGGSALCGIAPNLPTLVLARVIQAFGGGAITPTGLAPS